MTLTFFEKNTIPAFFNFQVMLNHKFKTNSQCVGSRNYSSAVPIEGDEAKTGQKNW